ncbi:phosphatase PAP2 family protein [Altererythrobacter arenosus]|uniref:Phosphatase PAP2 family protein n=1 Tax=Altererythrobacter arenosus TaxID=3032592 RepID=A0ABY8FSF8_9SPHN|nr:phosphatase PAP2 family protein [Altererythrobacter sp. CAU 1644]WFL77015.1 phosphatase PAP2 family protein [Altererythrobacter sp. CAU 1644]
MVAHFTAAVSLGERKLVDYFTWSWLQEVLTFSLMPPLLIFAGLVFRSVRAQPSNVLGHLGETLRENRERFFYGFLFILIYLIVHRAYRALKVAIPRHNEYWADPMFASWDKAIFGQDPWLITHSMVGPLGTQFIDMLYVVWLPVMLISFGFAAFAKDSQFRKRATLSFFLTWILLGNLLATLFASVGPCFYAEFYGSDRFTPLMDLLSHQNLAALKLQETLRMTVGDEAIGSGISAVPSLHCAITMIVVLMVHDRYGWDWRTYLAIAYHVIIWFGSVHLGWHYAVDGMISTALIPFIWWASGKIVTLSERLPKKQPAPAVA